MRITQWRKANGNHLNKLHSNSLNIIAATMVGLNAKCHPIFPTSPNWERLQVPGLSAYYIGDKMDSFVRHIKPNEHSTNSKIKFLEHWKGNSQVVQNCCKYSIKDSGMWSQRYRTTSKKMIGKRKSTAEIGYSDQSSLWD